MCVTILYGGRLGNNMLQYAAGHIFAKKHGYQMDTPPSYGGYFPLTGPREYFFNDYGKYFNVDTSTGSKFFKEPAVPLIEITNTNIRDYINANSVPDAHYLFNDWFQDPKFVTEFRQELVDVYKPVYKPRDPDDLFVSVRLGDIMGRTAQLPYEYYNDSITSIKFKTGYISSDTMEHPLIKQLIDVHGLIPYYQKDPLVKLDFAKDFNRLVLSEGTYCWWMGTLSRAQTIICNNRHFSHEKNIWHGDIFVYPDWIRLAYGAD